jgi:hypothetical protein
MSGFTLGYMGAITDGEIFSQHKGVESIPVIAGMSFYQEIFVTFVKGESRLVVHCGLQEDSVTVGGAKASFGAVQQFGTDSSATSRWKDVDGDDVTSAALARLGDDEPDEAGTGLGYDGERIATFDVGFELDAGVRNIWHEALLIDFPEDLEVFGPEIAHREVHRAIVNGFVSASAT